MDFCGVRRSAGDECNHAYGRGGHEEFRVNGSSPEPKRPADQPTARSASERLVNPLDLERGFATMRSCFAAYFSGLSS